MQQFQNIHALAIKRKGGRRQVERRLPPLATTRTLTSTPDDRWLAAMTRQIFQSGFNSAVVLTRWGAFEQAFHGFDIDRCARMNIGELNRLLNNNLIVRNEEKISSVRDNARFLRTLRNEYGSTGKFLVRWPHDDFSGLLDHLAKNGCRLGGTTAQYFLRCLGYDGYILAPDVVTALIKARIIDSTHITKTPLRNINRAFNHWHDETGLPLAHISKILGLSAGANLPDEGQITWTPCM